MLFNEKLKMLRKESGFTQEELAEKINVSRQAITKWESGDGTPDIENLKQLSNLFNTTIDELVKEEKNVTIEEKNQYVYTEELEIDHTKNFDIKIGKNNTVNIFPNDEERVKVEVESNEVEDLENNYKIEFDNRYNNLDIDIKNSKKVEDSVINLYIPEKYIDEIELDSKIKELNISNIDIKKLEYDGELKYLNVKNTKGDIVLNATRCDVEATYDKLNGSLEVNTINSTTRVTIPKGSKYKTILKGTKNQFVDAVNTEEADNSIELNGLNSKLIVIEE